MSDDNRNNEKDKNGTDGVWGFVSDQPGGMSMNDAKGVQDRVLQLMQTNDVQAKINGAAQLMTEGQWDACIQAYAHIKNAHPEQAALCESQVGAAEFFKGNYDNAIQHYELAKSLGADLGMMDMNIAEAKEKMAKSATMAMDSLQPPQQRTQEPSFVPVPNFAPPSQPQGMPQHNPNLLPANSIGSGSIDNNDIIAMVLSFFIFPGIGHIIAGQTTKGIAIMVTTVVTCGLLGLMWPIALVDLYMVLMAKKQRELGTWDIFPKI